MNTHIHLRNAHSIQLCNFGGRASAVHKTNRSADHRWKQPREYSCRIASNELTFPERWRQITVMACRLKLLVKRIAHWVMVTYLLMWVEVKVFSCDHLSHELGEPTASFIWTGWVREITGWSSKTLWNSMTIFREIDSLYIPQSDKAQPKGCNMKPVGLGNTGISTGYAHKSPRTALRVSYLLKLAQQCSCTTAKKLHRGDTVVRIGPVERSS